MNRPASTHTNGCDGFSLVELMIAMVVGLLLLAGVLQILLGNRESFEAQSAMAHVQENARLASFVLENSIAHAGYRTDLSASTESLFRADSKSGTAPYQAGAAIAGLTNTKGQSDAIRMRFQAEGGIHNCRGTEIGSPGTPKTTDFEFYVNDDDTLICHVFPDAAGNGEDRQPIVENVDRFEVRYGFDTSGATAGIDRYLSNLSGQNTTQIRSVRVQLLLRSPDKDNVLPTGATKQYTFSDDRSPVSFGPDRLGRVLLDQTIALKNALR